MSASFSAPGAQQQRFAAYLDSLAQAAGHQDRAVPLESYCTGLLLPGERKSVEPMAARLAPDDVQRMHQSLHHFIANAPWSDQALLETVRQFVLPVMKRNGSVVAWIVDDTGFVKKGTHSVGVVRQSWGQVGKQENCRVAVSLSVATEQARLPIAWRLYLPEIWTKDRERLSELRLAYVVGIQGTTTVWRPGAVPQSAKRWKGRGRPAKLLRRDKQHQPLSVKQLAQSWAASAWGNVSWREGTKQRLHSRFAALRVRVAHRDYWRSELRREEWLLIEWPRGESEPTKYWLSTLPADSKLVDLVKLAKHRWIVERDYEELKQELGLGHYEGRGWRGFHHHGTLCIAAYGFLVAERSRFSPSARARHLDLRTQKIPPDFRPRGSSHSRRAA